MTNTGKTLDYYKQNAESFRERATSMRIFDLWITKDARPGILSAIVGPFEAMHALNKARQKRKEKEDE